MGFFFGHWYQQRQLIGQWRAQDFDLACGWGGTDGDQSLTGLKADGPGWIRHYRPAWVHPIFGFSGSNCKIFAWNVISLLNRLVWKYLTLTWRSLSIPLTLTKTARKSIIVCTSIPFLELTWKNCHFCSKRTSKSLWKGRLTRTESLSPTLSSLSRKISWWL